jgi:hypothetical protein
VNHNYFSKISALSSIKKEFLETRSLIIILTTWLLCFYKPLIGRSYTAWDTHDLGFANFLYFSDSLKSGYIPLWNHFIQSGIFVPNFNNIGLYYPFQLIFVGLSWVISPLYAYELLIQLAVLIGGIGSYLLFRTSINDRLIALFGATAFAVVVLVPIVGQISFLISLSSFPWLILSCIKLMESRSVEIPRNVIWGALVAMYLASGYLWLNLMNFIIAGIFSLGICVEKCRHEKDSKKLILTKTKNLLSFLGVAALLYGCMALPGYLSMQFNYTLLSGDYVSPDPRLRSLAGQEIFSYGSILQAIVATIDPRIISTHVDLVTKIPRWSFGAGWGLWFLFLTIPMKKLSWQPIFWLLFGIAMLFYSAGNNNFIGTWIGSIPVINANRWWFNGTFYVTICLIFLVMAKISSISVKAINSKIHDIWVLFVGTLSLILLAYFESSIYEYILMLVSLGLVWLLGREEKYDGRRNWLTALIILNVVTIISVPHCGLPLQARYLSTSGADEYSQQINSRENDVVITQNHRKLGEGLYYSDRDEEWLLGKTPFSHGYNNLGNPYYWYLKNEPFLEPLAFVTQTVRPELEIKRNNFASDNEFVVAMMEDVLVDPSRPTIDVPHYRELLKNINKECQIEHVKIEPNAARIRVNTSGAAFLIFNNVNHSGWEVFVNGKKTDLIRANRIFQGVFLDSAGSYDVVFKFRPEFTIVLILLPYLVILGCLIAAIANMRRRISDPTIKR